VIRQAVDFQNHDALDLSRFRGRQEGSDKE
jgi:hypothetical protein